MGIRSFLAFELPAPILERLEILLVEARSRLEGVRWVPARNIHLTLVFLGDIEGSDMPVVKEEVQRVCARYGPFRMKLTGLGVFGGRRSPRVLWVGMSGDVERMGFLKGSLEKALAVIGLKREERPFKPHLTLGRFREGFRGLEALSGLLDRYQQVGAEGLVFKELCLFKSELGPGGSVYTRLGNWELTGSK